MKNVRVKCPGCGLVFRVESGEAVYQRAGVQV